MNYFTERNGIRKTIMKTYDISDEIYGILYDCCKKYFDNIAYKFPEKCHDSGICCGLDFNSFNNFMKYEIPDLYKRLGSLAKPNSDGFELDLFEASPYNTHSILDLIEFMHENILDIKDSKWHQYFKHNDLIFTEDTKKDKLEFKNTINQIFLKTGLLYKLSNDGKIERVVENEVLTQEICENIQKIKEPGLKELLNDAITKHKSHLLQDSKDAVEKIWDAFERLKTYHTKLDKKKSANKIIDNISQNEDPNFKTILCNEFNTLTDIGNNFKIRHHETNKVEVNDIASYDYLFDRCLSVISLAIKHLE